MLEPLENVGKQTAACKNMPDLRHTDHGAVVTLFLKAFLVRFCCTQQPVFLGSAAFCLACFEKPDESTATTPFISETSIPGP